MRFGLNLPNFGSAVSPDSLAGWATRAEDAGFDLLLISDHVAQTRDVRSRFPGDFYEPLSTLAWLAARTNRIRLGTTVLILPYRHPLLTARMVANIDQFCGGRFVLGVAAGWATQEFAALGVPYRGRGAITDEYLRVLRRLWTEGSVDGVVNTPRPVRTPPIWVGGHSAPALRRAVRYGDAWHPTSVSLSWLRREGLPALRRIAGQEGREAPALAPRIKLRVTDHRIPDHERLAGEGTLDQIRSDLEQLAELGATDVVLDTTILGVPRPAGRDDDDWAQIARLCGEVIDVRKGSLRGAPAASAATPSGTDTTTGG
ncbi:TIGR03619 family F420-dependent LLM class oxidoreductase [Pseudonocardia thermophila]|uniref:TIGR03619 family F420-dependent LLM class oxidoreductase n=1 Tax=Pseudonocardia thermophila TaxID=1848 RepID=UPI00248E316A|nr:TIGR03619 family F420-dependent LLM class oxidoreductase [Pseudonocardia thermophila]